MLRAVVASGSSGGWRSPVGNRADASLSTLLHGRFIGITIALAIVLAAAALVSIWRSGAHAPAVKIIWTALVVLVPFVGPCAWLLLGRVRRRVR